MTAAWLADPVRAIDAATVDAARRRQASLTKPPGSLGRLEELAVRLAAMQGSQAPSVERVRVTVFAADHGVAAESVSAYPQSVTVEMVRNFARGGAAISVLARSLGMTLEVVNVGTLTDPGALPGVVDRRIAAGTTNFRHAPAMTDAQLTQALDTGREAVGRARDAGAELWVGGEMGIGNTTCAAALACALLGLRGAALAGPGTGLDAGGVARKAEVIDAALARHRPDPAAPWTVLRDLGGFELAALCGAYVHAAQRGLPVVIDGFIAGVAALAATRLRPGVADWFFYAHRSAEPGHARVLAALGAEPLLDLGMRLGEGSGAALAVALLRQAVALHARMATFAEAGVTEGL
ncbi:MAG TPA: nicotinate-nucleotide--dimethylbenzimidazole phosphoribosyltransferase [Acidiferrobacterales bacterium]|jgi:nicotinate-nucleotide--dimethylbenzimidazole phosphoribosyltransferase